MVEMEYANKLDVCYDFFDLSSIKNSLN